MRFVLLLAYCCQAQLLGEEMKITYGPYHMDQISVTISSGLYDMVTKISLRDQLRRIT